MSIIVTNEITIPPERAEVVAKKFAENSKQLVGFAGFQGFELCRPTEPADDRWLVVTHWDDEESYQKWVDSRDYANSHPGEQVQKEPKNSVVRHYAVAFETERN